MNSTIFKLDAKDFAKGLVVAVLSGVLTWILQALSVPGFSFYTIQWGEILRVAIEAGGAYLLKNYLTDSQGKFGGIL